MWEASIDSIGEVMNRFKFSTLPFYIVAVEEYNNFWNKYVEATIEHARAVGRKRLTSAQG
jgi:hypothetical protein